MTSTHALAWAAGFTDGEGCFSVRRSRGIASIQFTITQVDPRPLQRFVYATGLGRVRGPFKAPSHRGKPYYKIVHTGGTAEALIEMLWPYLSAPKQEQITRVRALVAQGN